MGRMITSERKQRLALARGRTKLLARLDLGVGGDQQFVHGAADLVLGLVDAGGDEILFHAQSQHEIAGVGRCLHGDEFVGVGLRLRVGLAELFGRPKPKQFVAARLGAEINSSSWTKVF